MNAIFTRTSVRKFEDRPVEKEKIEKLLQAGFVAPSAGNQQPWEFYVVTKRETIEALAKTSPYAGAAAKAPVVLASLPARTSSSQVSRISTVRLQRKTSGLKWKSLASAAS